MAERHRLRRLWWAPWRRRCACGFREWPCPAVYRAKAPSGQANTGQWGPPGKPTDNRGLWRG
jgi:hypothetical protein